MVSPAGIVCPIYIRRSCTAYYKYIYTCLECVPVTAGHSRTGTPLQPYSRLAQGGDREVLCIVYSFFTRIQISNFQCV
jgi:hypothetical protein